jgi:hypothetical protein
LGPKKASVQPSLICLSPTIVSVPRHLPLICDPNLTPEELQIYRGLFYSYTTETWTQGCIPIVMRFLWGEYGLTFSNDALMSAVLIRKLPEQSMRKEERNSKFRQSIVKAICTQAISTEHLFAIFLVMFDPTIAVECRWIHMKGFETVLRYLIDHGTLSALANKKPLLSVLLCMVSYLQRRAQHRHRSFPHGLAYKFISDLKYLSEHLQPPSQTVPFLIESASLSAIFPNGLKTPFLSGLVGALDHIETDIFMFVYGLSQDEPFQPPIPSGELITAEEKFRVLENSALVKEIFTRV